SLLVAVTIVPMLAHSLFKKRLAKKAEETEVIKDEHGKIATFYKGVLDWALNHKFVTFGGAVVILVASLFLIPVIGASFLPDEEHKIMIVTYSPDPGQTREAAEEIVFDAESFIGDRDGVTMYQFSLGSGNPMGAAMGMGNDNSALFFVEYDKAFKNFDEESTELIDELNDQTE